MGKRRRFAKTGPAKTRGVAKIRGQVQTLLAERCGDDTCAHEDTSGRSGEDAASRRHMGPTMFSDLSVHGA